MILCEDRTPCAITKCEYYDEKYEQHCAAVDGDGDPLIATCYNYETEDG